MGPLYVDVDEMLSMINKVVFEELEKAPLPDVQEVKHAQWKGIAHPMYSQRHQRVNVVTEYMCSNCQNVEDYKANYCPYCGAKMDGGEDNETRTDL